MQDRAARPYGWPTVPFPTNDEDKTATPGAPGSQSIASPAGLDPTVAVLSVSAGMVGVCLTSIGIIKLLPMSTNALAQFADDLLASTALLFLCNCIVSFQVIKRPRGPSRRRLESVADTLFLIGLALMVVVCALITYFVI